jgi:hypothetical protein
MSRILILFMAKSFTLRPLNNHERCIPEFRYKNDNGRIIIREGYYTVI